jgi:hypothetical protein
MPQSCAPVVSVIGSRWGSSRRRMPVACSSDSRVLHAHLLNPRPSPKSTRFRGDALLAKLAVTRDRDSKGLRRCEGLNESTATPPTRRRRVQRRIEALKSSPAIRRRLASENPCRMPVGCSRTRPTDGASGIAPCRRGGPRRRCGGRPRARYGGRAPDQHLHSSGERSRCGSTPSSHSRAEAARIQRVGACADRLPRGLRQHPADRGDDCLAGAERALGSAGLGLRRRRPCPLPL